MCNVGKILTAFFVFIVKNSFIVIKAFVPINEIFDAKL